MEDQDYHRVRQRVARKLALKASFYFNLAFFLMVIVAILTDSTPDSDRVVGAAVFAVLWGAILLAHGNVAFNWFGGVIDRATRKEIERNLAAEKPKRHELALSDDGELIEISEVDETVDKPKRAGLT
ncbi:MAG: hypothetical protein IH587_07460 [Anaerolineae bacterium]|nr:hypothetical protein [Anaerolineae bacterium]